MLGDTLARLYALAPRGARLGLVAMEEACAKEGDPQNAFSSIHVAGTNGKGSVCATIEAIARAAGMKVGLYTSPHLQRFAERIRIDGKAIDDASLDALLGETLDRHRELTFFEVATLAAFEAFRDAKVDLAVIEVGLGGRLDATNVIARPRATAVTTLALDHVAILGGTIEAIAFEKAGIAKAGVPLVIGRVPDAARAVVEARAKEVGASPVWRLGEEIDVRAGADGSVTVRAPDDRSITARPALGGAHQRDNAAVAVATTWAAGLSVDEATIARAVATMVDWPGRLEPIATADGSYLLDGAHNVEGAGALAAALASRAEPSTRRALVFGAMGDKDASAMLALLAPTCATRIFTAPRALGGGRAAIDPRAFAAIDPGGRVVDDPIDAIAAARAAVGSEGVVVVAGSLYLVGEARAFLRNEPRDPQVGL